MKNFSNIRSSQSSKDFFSSSNSQISHMSKETGMDIYLKKDYMQYTGSFKERGARFTLLMLTDDQKRDGVIAASAGNHALALAYHGGQLSKDAIFTSEICT